MPTGRRYRGGLVDLGTGLISREIFVNEEIYAEELERVFTRAWLFVGHETQIPSARHENRPVGRVDGGGGVEPAGWHLGVRAIPILAARRLTGRDRRDDLRARHRGDPVNTVIGERRATQS